MTPKNDKGELLARWKGRKEVVALAGITNQKRALELLKNPGNDISVRSASAKIGLRLVKASELEVPFAT